MIKIAVDAMGGDNAPNDIVKGSLKFVNDFKNAKLFLVGDKDSIEKAIGNDNYNKEQIEIVHTSEIITNDEKPMEAIRNKSESSLVKAIQMVKHKEADAIISAGSTGALLAGATTIIGRIKGVKRPTLAAVIPASKNKNYILVDSGANVDARPEYIVQFAILGSIYMEKMYGINSPKVGLVNVGTEESKGNEIAKETHELLKDTNLNFIGNIEAREIPSGDVDVVACDGFTGNVVLKLTEGMAIMIKNELKNSIMKSKINMIGAKIASGAFKDIGERFNHKKAGGAPIIGLRGLAVKAHGNSDDYAFYQGLKQCYLFVEKDITGEIKAYFESGKKNEK